MSREDWAYTFADARTGVELATLPLTGVGYGRDLSGAGKLNAYLHLADDKIRALDPWAATITRRTQVFAEYKGRTVWGGMLNYRERSDTSDGLDLSAVTFEGWLHRQLLLADLIAGNVTTRTVLTNLVDRAQALTDVGLEVDAGAGPGQVRSVAYLAREIKPVLELIEGLGTSTAVPLEFRVDCFRDVVTGRFRKVLRWGEPRIGRTYEQTRRTFAYPDGGLTRWRLIEDGTGADNVMPMLGSGTGEAQPFGVLTDAQAGIDEIASGYPSWMRPFQASDTDNLDLIRARSRAAMRSGIAGEYVLTGVELRAPDYLGTVDPGDDLAFEIRHRSLKEWPKPVEIITRVLGESVTVGDGGDDDRVTVTIGGTP